MKVKVFGRDKKEVEKLSKELRKDFTISNTPEVVISYGGDGTYLLSERRYPGIPKLLVRHKSRCYKCTDYGLHSKDKIKEILSKRKYKIVNFMKLEAKTGNRRLVGVNDIIIRNKKPNVAIRFNIQVKGKIDFKEIIGDGIVVSTSIGSTGYFNSITGQEFKKGIGIAFNNPIYHLNPILVNSANIKIRILREDALLAADNNNGIISLKPGNEVIIKTSKEKARIIKVKK